MTKIGGKGIDAKYDDNKKAWASSNYFFYARRGQKIRM
jgi:hypothetical protein